jgi:hypothetical protein
LSVVLSWWLSCDLRRLVVADVRIERGDEHQRIVQKLGDAFTPRLDARSAMLAEALAAVGEEPHALQEIWIITGLNTFNSEVAHRAATLMTTSLPNTWQQAMVSASDCVGFTLPGMIELPGSFSGILSSPIPQRGPEASQRMSLAIFISDAASVFSAPCA